MSSSSIPATDRLIVALDVPTTDEALRVVRDLDNVSFFKVGLQLFVAGELPRLLRSLQGKKIFVDLKVPGDIANTLAAVIDLCVDHGVAFLTVSGSMPPPAIASMTAARDARHSAVPKLLTVPYLSSLDANDLGVVAAGEVNLDDYIVRSARAAIQAGCDGIIASGKAIGVCRSVFPRPTAIVSPGIRPQGTSTNDHKRPTTPAEAIRMGADYLVVGRPILQDPRPRQAASRVLAEIESALVDTPTEP